jgi:hypothetical protein
LLSLKALYELPEKRNGDWLPTLYLTCINVAVEEKWRTCNRGAPKTNLYDLKPQQCTEMEEI